MPLLSPRRLTSIITLWCVFAACAQADLRDDALIAAKKATSFLTDHVSTHGGYLWRYSADLKLREGEGIVTTQTVWVQPPGTPAVGEAFVKLYRATGEKEFLDAAMEAADALRKGQMRSGGWQAMIEFEQGRRKKWAYRIDPQRQREKDQSSLDDAKTQSALKFLIQLDDTLQFKNERLHEMVMFGLDSLLTRGQFSGGGFPQVWTGTRSEQDDTPLRRASYPNSWSREYTGHHEYWYRYTLNDHLARDTMEVLLLAEQVYQDDVFGAAAIRLADSLLAAQMPDPQPAWAQQYSTRMQPIWARKFEPPAIVTSESYSVIDTLIMVYRRTGDRKYLNSIPAALDYLESCELPDGKVARFYELKTNRPLYFDRDYKLTYDDSDMPTHYGFKLDSGVAKLRKRLEFAISLSRQQIGVPTGRSGNPNRKNVRQIIDRLDSRGAWLSDEGLRYYKLPGSVIDMGMAVKHLTTLADFLAAAPR